jgi:hypothetical protein
MDLESRLAAIEVAVADADAELTTVLGGHRESVQARLWRGRVLVDWEPDDSAGDCLLRPELLRRLLALHAQPELTANELRIQAPGRTVSSLSAEHADLVARMGGARRLVLRIRLRFEASAYIGGEETYEVVGQGRSAPLLRLVAEVKPRAKLPASPRTSPAPT